MKFTTMFKTSFALSAAFGLALSAPAVAGTFSVSGPGASIIDGVGTWNTSLPVPSTSSTVSLSRAVTSVTSVTITGLTHTWVGDVHFILKNPAGQRTNVFARPGLTSATSFGNASDFLGGTYTFVSTGFPALPSAGNPAAGTYIQNFGGSGAGLWTNTGLSSNGLLSGVSGSAGTWTLECYDWGGGDVGSFSGWTLAGTDASITALCFGDGTGTACPCLNSGNAGRGCKSSAAGSIGCLLTAVDSGGNPGPSTSVTTNDLGLKSTGMNMGSYCIFLQGTATVNAGLGSVSPSYDGLECIGGTMVRLGRITTMGGTNTLAGVAGVAGLSATAQTLYYQAVYRNKLIFCTPATLNTSNALQVCWTP